MLTRHRDVDPSSRSVSFGQRLQQASSKQVAAPIFCDLFAASAEASAVSGPRLSDERAVGSSVFAQAPASLQALKHTREVENVGATESA